MKLEKREKRKNGETDNSKCDTLTIGYNFSIRKINPHVNQKNILKNVVKTECFSILILIKRRCLHLCIMDRHSCRGRNDKIKNTVFTQFPDFEKPSILFRTGCWRQLSYA